jgi:hypothetical protein
LGADAQRLILDTVNANISVEVGGWLLSRDPDLHVASATSPGSRAKCSRDQYEPDIVGDDALLEQLDRTRGLQPIGTWHVHVRGAGRERGDEYWPSAADLRAWSSQREHFGIDRFVALIVVAEPRRWEQVEWICHLVEDNATALGDVTRRCRVV